MKNIKYAVCYLVIILMASIPLFNNYLIRGHDIYFHLMRIEGLAQGLRAGDNLHGMTDMVTPYPSFTVICSYIRLHC